MRQNRASLYAGGAQSVNGVERNHKVARRRLLGCGERRGFTGEQGRKARRVGGETVLDGEQTLGWRRPGTRAKWSFWRGFFFFSHDDDGQLAANQTEPEMLSG